VEVRVQLEARIPRRGGVEFLLGEVILDDIGEAGEQASYECWGAQREGDLVPGFGARTVGRRVAPVFQQLGLARPEIVRARSITAGQGDSGQRGLLGPMPQNRLVQLGWQER